LLVGIGFKCNATFNFYQTIHQVQGVMRDERGFDLVIAEAFIEEAVYAFSEHFNVSVNKISSGNLQIF